jgi:hypothetical protein
MLQEQFFVLPIAVAPIMLDTVVPAPVVSSPLPTSNENLEPVLQDPLEPHVELQEEQQQQPQITPNNQNLRRSEKVRRSAISDDYEVYETEEFHMEDDPTTYEQSMRSEHSEKWLEAMRDEIRSMDSNKVWEPMEIPKGAKKVGCKWVYKTKYDSQENVERLRHDSWQKALLREKELITMRLSLRSHVKILLEL